VGEEVLMEHHGAKHRYRIESIVLYVKPAAAPATPPA
jgi:hypothetical protein